MGGIGSGKSSVLNMLLRLGNNSGIVRIDGYPVKDLKLKTLRETLSVIPQVEIFFTSKNNFLYLKV